MEQERISAYLCALEPEQEPLLRKLRAYAKENDVPILRPETESFLKTLVAAKQPRYILEIGTAIGYSGIVMARANPAARLLTIESYEKRIPLAEENFKRAGEALFSRVELVHDDAGNVLRQLVKEGKQFDFIFLDAAKGQYANWLPDIIQLLPGGGMLIADNVLQDNTVMESRFTVARRDRTTHERMRAFLYEIKHDKRLVSCVLPLGDGVSLSVRLLDETSAETGRVH